MTAPDKWDTEYPKITRLFRNYIVDQPEEVWAQQVRLYRQHGEKPLEFKGVSDELDKLSGNEVACADFLRDVLGLDYSPRDAYQTICSTYNELVLGEDAKGPGKGFVRIRNAPDWVPDLEEDSDATAITSKELYGLQLKARVPVLPGKWGEIPIINYLITSLVALAVGVLITLLLPFPVLAELGSILILLGLIGGAACALLLTTWRRYLLSGEDDEEDDDEDSSEESRKKPGRIRRLFSRS